MLCFAMFGHGLKNVSIEKRNMFDVCGATCML